MPGAASSHWRLSSLPALAGPASAQTYPTQNITFQVGFAAGGIADVVARLVGQKLDGAPGAHGGGGKSRRGRRQSRGEVRERRGARRLHHSRDHHRAGGQRDRDQEQGLLGRRSAHRRDRGVQSGCARDPSQQPGEGSARVHPERQDEGLHLWQRRRRHRSAYRRGIFLPRGREGAGGARAVHRRRAGGARPRSAIMSMRSC